MFTRTGPRNCTTRFIASMMDRMCLLYTIILQLLYDQDNSQKQHNQQDDDDDVYDDDLDIGQTSAGTDLDTTKELVSEMALFDKIKLFLTRLGSPDFHFNDLTHPTPARVAKTLSVILNYVKSCDPSWQEYEAEAGQEETNLLETQKLQDEIHEIMHRNKEIQQKLDNLDPPLHELEAKLEELERSQQPLEEALKMEKDKRARVKNERQALKDTLASQNYKIMILGQEGSALQRRSEIDYSLILSKIEKAEKKIEQIEIATTSEKQKLEALTHTRDCQSEGFNSISKAYDLKMEIMQFWADMDQWKTAIKDLKDKIHDIDIKLNKLTGDKTNIQAKVKEMEMAHTELHAQMNKKRETISIHMAKIQDEHQKTIQEVAETKQQTHEYLEMNHRMALEAQKIKDDYTDYIEKRTSELHLLSNTLTSLNSRMDSLISE
ncbi:unnamed protein product [Absidia cylindrospora]